MDERARGTPAACNDIPESGEHRGQRGRRWVRNMGEKAATVLRSRAIPRPARAKIVRRILINATGRGVVAGIARRPLQDITNSADGRIRLSEKAAIGNAMPEESTSDADLHPAREALPRDSRT